jgi:hypothetical protein
MPVFNLRWLADESAPHDATSTAAAGGGGGGGADADAGAVVH